MPNNPFEDLVPKQQGQQAGMSQATNSFEDLIPKKENQPQSVGGGSSFMAAVEGFNRSYGRVAEGLLQLSSPILPQSFNEGLAKHNKREEVSYERAKEAHPVAARVGEFGGYASQGLVTPVARGSLAKQVGALALTGGALGAAEYGDAGERAVRGTIGAAAGAAGGYLLNKLVTPGTKSAVKDVGLVQKMTNPEKAATRTIANQVIESGDDLVPDRAAAKALGIDLTPGQQLGNTAVAKNEARIALGTEEARAASAKYLRTQGTKLKAAVDDIVNNIVPEGDKAARIAQKKAYEGLAKKTIGKETQKELMQNPIIADELNALNNNRYTTQAVKALPDDSVLKLDKVKQEIDRSLYKDAALTADPDKAMGAETRRAFQEARRMIVEKLDSKFPEYAKTRKLSEKLILKSDMLDEISKIAPEAGKARGDISMDQLYQRLWNTPQKQEQFLNRLSSAGGDAQHASNVIEVMNQVRNSPIKKLLEKSSPEQRIEMFGGDLGGRVMQFFNKLTDGKYNKAYLNMVLDNKKWESSVNALLKKKSEKTMLTSLMKMLNDARKKLGTSFEKATNPKSK